jgi:hypothetical protein
MVNQEGFQMTGFQIAVLEWLGGNSRKLNGVWISPDDVRRSARLAERLYWTLN